MTETTDTFLGILLVTSFFGLWVFAIARNEYRRAKRKAREAQAPVGVESAAPADETGKPVGTTCPTCGMGNRAGAKYCGQCGGEL